MNLVELELEDYRQFLGTHRFTPGLQTMVGIIGRNGAGKTTLFEAMEWCLYNPGHIRNDDIRPRALPGKPRVKVTLEHPQTGEHYEIERELRATGTFAWSLRAGQPETPIVQGTRQVSDYVAKALIGLSHKAFVATFFTRQKELSFFGSMGPAERRREVGRLLGLETIRLAQESIGQQRQDKQQEARVKRSIFEQESTGKNFAEERQKVQAVIEARSQGLLAAEAALSEASTQLVQIRKELSNQQTRSDEHAQLVLAGSQLRGAQNEFAVQIQAATESLKDIEVAEAQLVELEIVATREPELASLVETHQREKSESDRIAELGRTALTLQQDEARAQVSVIEVSALFDQRSRPAQSVAEEAASGSLAPAIEELLRSSRSLDVDGLEADVSGMLVCSQQASQLRNDNVQLGRFREAAEQLRDQERKLAGQSDFSAEITASARERSGREAEAAGALATANTMQKRRDGLASLSARLAEGWFDDTCPACGRPFREAERERDVGVLTEQVALLDQQIEEQSRGASIATRMAQDAAKQEDAARASLEALRALRARLADSASHIESAELAVEHSRENLANLLRELQRDSPPDEADIRDARERLQAAQRRSAQIPRLEEMLAHVAVLQRSKADLERERLALGTSAYDPVQHQLDYAEWQKSRDAAAQVTIVRNQIEGRPAVLDRIAKAEVQIRETENSLHENAQQALALDFRPEALDAARTAEVSAQSQFNVLLGEKHQSESLLATARRDAATIDAEEKRLHGIRDASVAAQREADELDRMYKEFTRFEQHVALVVTPALAGLTSQLASAVTDGKYEEVEFTEDFGIEVYDGADDHFPLSQFSGGERDVIALCSRLALSQFVGGQAQSPLQFVVLDEVFGSLDRERRENLMETLQKLVEESGAFRQLFVISHVNDVRTSPAFDEIWRVDENSDGGSTLERVNAASAVEEF